MPYLEHGHFDVNLTFRYSSAHDHYSGDEEQTERTERGTNVINTQELWDLRATWAPFTRLNFALSIPYLRGSWSIPAGAVPAILLPELPASTMGEREYQRAAGIGDTTLVAKFWLFDPDTFFKGNLQLGAGVKFPTGEDNAKDEYSDVTGQNKSRKSVDVSIQPGDGGWGLTTELFAFRDIKPFRLFANGTYLVNPRNQNRTPSILVGLLGEEAARQVSPDTFYNSVPDQYQAQGGLTFPVPRAPGFSLSLTGGITGVPARDLIGDNDGFRRPGYFVTISPGFSLGLSPLLSLPAYVGVTAPVTLYRNRVKDARGQTGDATFADYAILATAGFRFGAGASPPVLRDDDVVPADAPPPAQPLSRVVVTDEEIVPLAPIYFDPGDATIKPESFPVLDEVVQILKGRSEAFLRVEGHTDSRGDGARNRRLSERRAQSVVRYLAREGIAAERLEALGLGESRPIASNVTEEGRAKNRRTEIHFVF